MIVDIMNNLNTLNKVIEDNVWAIDKDYNIACYRAAEENSNNGSTIVFSCVRLGD